MYLFVFKYIYMKNKKLRGKFHLEELKGKGNTYEFRILSLSSLLFILLVKPD